MDNTKFGYSYWNSLRQKSYEKSKLKCTPLKAKFAKWNQMKLKSFEKSKQKKAPVKARLKVYYDFHTRNFIPRCMECGAPIGRDQESVYGCQAHIVGKKIFVSVCDDLNNHLVLGRFCGCHGTYDSSWEAAMKMNCWPTVIEKFKTFADKIPVEESRQLPSELRQYCSV